MPFGIFVGCANCFNCLNGILECVFSSSLCQSMEGLLMVYPLIYPGFCSYVESSIFGVVDVNWVSSMCLSDFR